MASAVRSALSAARRSFRHRRSSSVADRAAAFSSSFRISIECRRSLRSTASFDFRFSASRRSLRFRRSASVARRVSISSFSCRTSIERASSAAERAQPCVSAIFFGTTARRSFRFCSSASVARRVSISSFGCRISIECRRRPPVASETSLRSRFSAVWRSIRFRGSASVAADTASLLSSLLLLLSFRWSTTCRRGSRFSRSR
mmetsp:Transcript_19867/g.46548  ORF Transcript_19867/g.46548 Transcript_19867/m.46548 type:complete len:202 (-) Transcript_19867:1003-1608(-)